MHHGQVNNNITNKKPPVNHKFILLKQPKIKNQNKHFKDDRTKMVKIK